MAVLKQNFKSPPTREKEDNGVMRRAVIFRSLKGGRREDENKKKLEEGHICDNSCRLYNLCYFSGRYGFKKKSNLCDLQILSSAKRLLTHNNTKQNGRGFARWTDEWMSGWLDWQIEKQTQQKNKQISGA